MNISPLCIFLTAFIKGGVRVHIHRVYCIRIKCGLALSVLRIWQCESLYKWNKTIVKFHAFFMSIC